MCIEYSLKGAQYYYDQWESHKDPLENVKVMSMYHHLITTEYSHHVLEPMYQYWYQIVSERVDELFEESMDLYMSESGMKDEYESDRLVEDFLESYSFDEKVMHLLKNNVRI